MDIDKELKRHFIGQLIERKSRVDERGFNEYRKIIIEKNPIDAKAEGSALVKLGNTEVLCGVKVDVAEPWPDKPNEGILTISAEFLPIASPEFEMGRPGEDAIELARVVDRGIRESKMIDMEKLVITPKEKVWSISADIHILNHDGNLLDAASYAAVVALKTGWIPKYDKENDLVVREKTMDIPINVLPVSCTFAKINGSSVIDPTLDEEFAMDSRITITTTGNAIHAMQKGGSGSFSTEEILKLTDIALLRYNEIVKFLE